MSVETEGKNRRRIYSAKERAESTGDELTEAGRVERELREELAREFGEPVIFRHDRNGEPVGIAKVNTAFYSALYARTRDVIHEIDEGRLYAYEPESGLWKPKPWEENLVDLSRFMLAESERESFGEIAGKRGLTLDRELQSYLKGMVARREIFAKEPNAPERTIHFRNGVFVIRNGKPAGFRKSFSKADYSRNQIPVSFEEGATCPRTIAELLRPALPLETAEDDIRVIFQWLGVALLGVNVAQKILIVEGAARAGKSTLLKLARLLVGKENSAQLRVDHLGERFEGFAYVGKTLLFAPDVPRKFLLHRSASQLKSLVGGDPLDVEPKAGNQRYQIDGNFSVIITVNELQGVRLEGDADAWERRILKINWNRHDFDKVPDFERVLLEIEGPGIVNRALQGLAEVLGNRGEITLASGQRRRVEDLLERSEPVAEFLRDRVALAEGRSLAKKSLRERFKEYCRERRWRIPSDREIGGKLPRLIEELFDVPEVNSIPDPEDFEGTKHVQGYRGICWLEE